MTGGGLRAGWSEASVSSHCSIRAVSASVSVVSRARRSAASCTDVVARFAPASARGEPGSGVSSRWWTASRTWSDSPGSA